MIKKIIALIFLTTITLNTFSQEPVAGKLILISDFNSLKELPIKVLIEKSDLGGYESTIDTCKINDKIFIYKTDIPEPELINVTCYWPGEKLTSTSFWALPSTYKLVISNNLLPEVIDSAKPSFSATVNDLKNQISNSKNISDSLVKNISYENHSVAYVEEKISHLRDSIENDIDENIYKKNILNHLNSPLSLYALCRYAERPYENQRIKSEPEKIEVLFNQLDISLKKLPSAIILLHKIEIGKQLKIGKVFTKITLNDTIGQAFKIGDFKDKYILIDFWASWCMPCRQESPGLKRMYKKYKVKGFQIISITEDAISSKTAWLKAIKQDHTNKWPQLSDFNNMAKNTYAIRFIPTNYLIDSRGIIIARDLKGKELEQTLKKLFGW